MSIQKNIVVVVVAKLNVLFFYRVKTVIMVYWDWMVYRVLRVYQAELVNKLEFFFSIVYLINDEIFNQGEPGDSAGLSGIVPGPRGDPGQPGRPGGGVSTNENNIFREMKYSDFLCRVGPDNQVLQVQLVHQGNQDQM